MSIDTISYEHPYYVVVCPACAVDLSKVSIGRIVLRPQGPEVDVYFPLRCPECQHPLLPAVKVSPIARPGGPLV